MEALKALSGALGDALTFFGTIGVVILSIVAMCICGMIILGDLRRDRPEEGDCRVCHNTTEEQQGLCDSCKPQLVR